MIPNAYAISQTFKETRRTRIRVNQRISLLNFVFISSSRTCKVAKNYSYCYGYAAQIMEDNIRFLLIHISVARNQSEVMNFKHMDVIIMFILEFNSALVHHSFRIRLDALIYRHGFKYLRFYYGINTANNSTIYYQAEIFPPHASMMNQDNPYAFPNFYIPRYPKELHLHFIMIYIHFIYYLLVKQYAL
uniref:Uncharacterized protein n=1 Tax=Glossina brevipalpis TaxID=37001 RepID=A0A1A9WRK5_9MUSC